MLQLMFGTPVDALSKNETLLSIAQKRNGTVFQLGCVLITATESKHTCFDPQRSSELLRGRGDEAHP
jgi:hypothetical protein